VSGLSDAFFVKLAELGKRHDTDPVVFLDVWNSESGLNPAAENAATHAQGLNQMMPGTLKGLGFPADRAFKDLAGEEQLPWIERLITMGQTINSGPFRTAARYYHSNFFPKTMGRGSSPDVVVVASDATDPIERAGYTLNKAMDPSGKGKITYADLTAFLNRAKNANRATYEVAFARLRDRAPASTAGRAPSSRADSAFGAAPVLVGLGVLAAAFVAWRAR
jgi:hypothetical protein